MITVVGAVIVAAGAVFAFALVRANDLQAVRVPVPAPAGEPAGSPAT